MSYSFQHLEFLLENMRSKEMSKCVFGFQYNAHPFSCIFVIDTTPFCLYITSLGEMPFCIEKKVNKDYTISTYLSGDEYKKLSKYLDLHYDKEHPFMPGAFFQSLDTDIKKIDIRETKYSDVLKAARLNRKVEEENKIFFCGWRNNNIRKYHVRPDNLEKTRLAFGDEVANKCRRLNLSSCWTDKESEENLTLLNEIISDTFEHGSLKYKK